MEKTLADLIDKLTEDGGAIISEEDCTELDIRIAKIEGWYGKNDIGQGFIWWSGDIVLI